METPYDNGQELRPCKRIVAEALWGKDFLNVLEVGSQWGENLVAIREDFPSVKLVGIDIDKETTDEAKKVTGLDLRLGNILDGNFQDKEFDVVFTEALFCMLEPNQVDRALKEVIRIARKYIVLVELKTSELVGMVYGGRTGANWVELFKKYGLEAKQTKIHSKNWEANPWKENGYIYEVDLNGKA